MKKIIISLAVILLSAGVIAGGATSAFFTDTETSTNNTFTAGALDLKIDNESYYNGNACADADGEGPGTLWVWQGNAPYPVPGSPCTTSWLLDDLDKGYLFFNFLDLKPDDEGEDTISIHVQNDAWACLDMSLTSNDDNSSTEPELLAPDAQDVEDDTWDGELADTIQMLWWADDGDNVYEEGEQLITDGVQNIATMFGKDKTISVALADTGGNVWGGQNPLPGGETVYIAKAWCMGTLTENPVQDNGGVNPSVDPGVTCDGTLLNNLTQTDGVTMDIAFRAVQARHNPEFFCSQEEERFATLTINKVLIKNNGGNEEISDFQLFADNGVVEVPMTSGVANQVVAPATYTITETGVSGYVATFSGDCDVSGQITLEPGENKQCTITNDDLPGNITLIKNVINNNGGTAASTSAWGLRIDGSIVPNNLSVAVTANANHFINEDGRAGYHFVSITGAGCPISTSTPVVLNEGQSITCTITNDDNVPPPLVENFGSGTCLTDIAGWDEDAGESCTTGTVAAAIGSGDNTVSPEGGRFGLLSGNNGFICRSVNATGLTNLALKYYWRGDTDAEDNETGSVGYFTTGTCAAPGPVTNLAMHELDDTNNNASEPWSSLQSINLPGALDNTSFFIRFSADSNGGNESFRLDGISITGI
jgi:predicted ribosomally synthesized peptide with SipW-like signal peptide